MLTTFFLCNVSRSIAELVEFGELCIQAVQCGSIMLSHETLHHCLNNNNSLENGVRTYFLLLLWGTVKHLEYTGT